MKKELPLREQRLEHEERLLEMQLRKIRGKIAKLRTARQARCKHNHLDLPGLRQGSPRSTTTHKGVTKWI